MSQHLMEIYKQEGIYNALIQNLKENNYEEQQPWYGIQNDQENV